MREKGIAGRGFYASLKELLCNDGPFHDHLEAHSS